MRQASIDDEAPQVCAWVLASQVRWASCDADEEITVHLAYHGSMHVISGFGYFILKNCIHYPQTIDALVSRANSSFEPEADVDLQSAVEKVIHQLSGLGILAPCPQST